MTSIFWIVFLTFYFVVVQAEAWLPTGIVKFRQRVRRKTKRSIQRNSTTDNNNVENENDGDVITEGEDEDAERQRLSLLPWWEDSWSEAFMNSFPLSTASAALNFNSSSNPDPQAIVEDELAHYETPTPNPTAQVLHFCFLLHGHRGFATDLSYLQRVMQHHAELEKRERNDSSDNNNNDTPSEDMIVHCAVCNEGKTTDGVVNGGERLVQEIKQVIRKELEQRNNNNNNNDIQDITISIVGNSLGGIYGRYAIAQLAQQADPMFDDKYRLHFNIFCTTATPHLGISKHTYVPLPRSVERGAAHVLGDTGRDLFRLNDLMKTMATCPSFLEPLRKFRKRVAYANAFATDFPVPASTAAFLSADSTYPHHFASENESKEASDDFNNQSSEEEANRHVVATLHTPAAKDPPKFPATEQEAIADDLMQMSYSLDSLGWKKVFVDVRREIPIRVALPRSMTKRSMKRIGKNLLLTPRRLRKSLSQSMYSNTSDDTTDSGSNNLVKTAASVLLAPGSNNGYDSDSSEGSKPTVSAIHRLRQKGVVQSKDVASVVSTPDDMRLSFPLGHNLMVALDRTGIAGGLYKGGRPVMDSLAKELVADIMDWDFQEENNVAQETLKRSEQFQSGSGI